MSQRLRKWLTLFAIVLTVAALTALASTRDRGPSHIDKAEAPGDVPGNHVNLLAGPR